MRSLCSLWTRGFYPRLGRVWLLAPHRRKGLRSGSFPRNALARRGGGGRLDTPRRDFASNYVIKTPPAVLGALLSTYLGLIRYRANWLPLLIARLVFLLRHRLFPLLFLLPSPSPSSRPIPTTLRTTTKASFSMPTPVSVYRKLSK